MGENHTWNNERTTAKVGNLENPAFVDQQQVFALDVPVDNVVAMAVGQASEHLVGVQLHVDPQAPVGLRTLDHIVQVVRVHEFQDEVQLGSDDPVVEELDHVHVAQLEVDLAFNHVGGAPANLDGHAPRLRIAFNLQVGRERLAEGALPDLVRVEQLGHHTPVLHIKEAQLHVVVLVPLLLLVLGPLLAAPRPGFIPVVALVRVRALRRRHVHSN